MNKREYTLSQLAELLGAKLQGDGTCIISGVATLQNASSGQITFLDNVKYRQYLTITQATAVIIAPSNLVDCAIHALILDNPYLGYAKIAKLFECLPSAVSGIHPTAVVGKNCKIDPSASIGPHCVIGDNVEIAANVILGAGCVIGDQCILKSGSRFWPNVTLYHEIKVGQRVIMHSGAVIGSDGFGFAQNRGAWEKIAQLGGVEIGDDVEIGANTSIDRGALDNTVIKDGVKIDNLVQIAHNVVIGEHTAIAGCVAVAGSTKIGKHCAIGGGVGIAGHLTICDGSIITGGSLVAQSIDSSGVYTSGVGVQPTLTWKKNLMRIYQLDDMSRRLRKLEKLLSRVEKEEPV